MKNANRPTVWLVLAGSIAVGLLACSTDSLWIDEAWMARIASEKTFQRWWSAMREISGSTLQMPLYTFYLWAWEKLVGHSEFALRAGNIAWFMLGQVALFQALRRRSRLAWTTVVLGALSPLVWFYLNDARPYIMHYAGACLLGNALFAVSEHPSSAFRPSGIWTFGIGLLVLCGSSLLGAVWAAGAVAAWLFLLRGVIGSAPWRGSLAPLAATLVSLTLLGSYYLWTICVGTGASMVGDTSLLNLAFISYEFSGIAGLGPGRLHIRQDGFSAFFALGGVRLSFLIAVAFVSLGIFAQGLRTIPQAIPRRGWIAILICVFPPALFLLALGYVHDFRLLGRHYIPLLPLVLAVTALGVTRMSSHRSRIFALSAICGIWLMSALSLRFSDRHQKDDYRRAAEVAKTALAQRELVWWSADQAAASYYGVPFEPSPENANTVTLILRPDFEQLTRLPQPTLVIASKPDIYDGSSDALKAYLLAKDYQPQRDIPSFTIWRPADRSPADR